MSDLERAKEFFTSIGLEVIEMSDSHEKIISVTSNCAGAYFCFNTDGSFKEIRELV